jgi:hypothetical protein
MNRFHHQRSTQRITCEPPGHLLKNMMTRDGKQAFRHDSAATTAMVTRPRPTRRRGGTGPATRARPQNKPEKERDLKNYLTHHYIRLRCKKQYPEAHTHIIIGEVEAETSRYVAVKGRTFHFRRLVDQLRSQVHCGQEAVRVIPWENIEIIHRLEAPVDYLADITFDKHGNLILADKAKTVIAEKRSGLE